MSDTRVNIAEFDEIVEVSPQGPALLEIIKAEVKVTEKTKVKFLNVGLKIIGMLPQQVEKDDGTFFEVDPQGEIFYVKFFYPHAGQKDGGKFCRLNMKKFANASGVEQDTSGFDYADLPGRTLFGILIESVYQDSVNTDVKPNTWKTEEAGTEILNALAEELGE